MIMHDIILIGSHIHKLSPSVNFTRVKEVTATIQMNLMELWNMRHFKIIKFKIHFITSPAGGMFCLKVYVDAMMPYLRG